MDFTSDPFPLSRSRLLPIFLLICLCTVATSSPAKPTVPWDDISAQFPSLQRPDIRSDDPSTTVTRQWLTTLRHAWLNEQNPKKRELLRWRLWDDAKYLYEDQYLDEVIAGGLLPETEVRSAEITKTIELKLLLPLPEMLVNEFPQWVIRTVGEKHFECWTTSTGYLFSTSGKLIKRATINRKDGRGREWYGAFLPTGAYCTTDIWDHDRQLHVFTNDDEWIRSLTMPCQVAWARSAGDETTWIVRSSTDHCGSHLLRVTAEGTTSPLEGLLGDAVPWRQIGPYRQSSFVELLLPSDDSIHLVATYTAGHGRGAEFKTFHLYPAKGQAQGIPRFVDDDVISSTTLYYGTRHYGFFPNSLCLWAQSSNRPDGMLRTWLLSETLDITGWVAGEHIGEGAPPQSELFKTETGEVITVTPDANLLEKRQFHINGETAKAVWLADKAKFGFFIHEDQLHVAKW